MRAKTLASDHPKLIYFAERRSDMDAAAFRARWRQHARLGMSLPRWRNIQHYAHCDAISIAGSRLPLDACAGIGIICYRDEARRLKHLSDRSAAPLMRQDETETFARPVREVAILADEFTLQACDASTHKLFLRIWRQPSLSLAEFRCWWLDEAAAEISKRLSAVNSVQGYIQNHARLVQSENAPPPLCDCVDEISCADVAACEAVISQLPEQLRGLGDYVNAWTATWTSETVLYDLR